MSSSPNPNRQTLSTHSTIPLAHHNTSTRTTNKTVFYTQTKEILHETFSVLLFEEGTLKNTPKTTRFTSEVNKKAFHSLQGACRYFIKHHRDDIRQQIDQLDLSNNSLCTTYHKAVSAMFIDDINWGRIVALISFSVLVAVKVHDTFGPNSLESIEGWLLGYVSNNLQQFIRNQKSGWGSISDKFSNDNSTHAVAGGKTIGGGGSWLTVAAVGLGVLMTALITSSS